MRSRPFGNVTRAKREGSGGSADEVKNVRIRMRSVLLSVVLVLAGGALSPAHAASNGGSTLGLNWAGYVVDSPHVSAVSTEFVVPTVQMATPGFVAEWAGIGGFTTNDLIQAGAGQEYIPGLGVQYFAWWETLPNAETQIPGKPVQPGDHMSVSITNTAGSSWTIEMADSTRGWTFSKTLNYKSTNSSAEWIVEAPQLGPGVQTLPPLMGPAVFDGAANTVTVGGTTKLIGNADPVQLIVDDATVAPSAIDSGGDGFSVCEYSISCSPPA